MVEEVSPIAFQSAADKFKLTVSKGGTKDCLIEMFIGSRELLLESKSIKSKHVMHFNIPSPNWRGFPRPICLDGPQCVIGTNS